VKTLRHSETAESETMRFHSYPMLFLLLFLAFAKAATRKCSHPPPAPKPGGSYEASPPPKRSQYRNGTVVTYTCKKKYILKGVTRRVCGEDGKWDPQGRKTRCILIKCGKFPTSCNLVWNASHTGPVYPFKSIVDYACPPPLELQGPSRLVCNHSKGWFPLGEKPCCRMPSGCLKRPPPPPVDGSSTDDGRIAYHAGERVNYSCPSGYGLDGIPYRTCSRHGIWEPHTPTPKHSCRANLTTCPDPGIPENGIRRVQSFAHGSMAVFGCPKGYKHQGNHFRTCHASDPNNTFWDGEEAICIDMFKSSNELAAQLRETFIDRTLSCETPDADVKINISESSGETPDANARSRVDISEFNNTVTVSGDYNSKRQNAFCLGRRVVLGEGCVDLMFAIDCSGSMKGGGFLNSTTFVTIMISLFEIERGNERAFLMTYDDNVHVQFSFSDVNSTEEAIKKVENATLCGGATSATRLLQFVIDRVVSQTRPGCKKALFIISDGQNNWGGDPQRLATRLKTTDNFELYTIAIGQSELAFDSLQQLATSPNHFFAVKNSMDVYSLVNKAIKVPPDYGGQCGRVVTTESSCRDNLGDHCRSQRGAWPWMVGIYALEASHSRPQIVCGGVLIGNCHVLTAAHCLQKHHGNSVLVVVGNTDRDISERSERTFEVESVTVHKLYDKTTLDYDLALLKLHCNVTYSVFVKRLCLPDCERDGQLIREGELCTVAGWGATEIDSDADSFHMSTHLHHIEIPIANHDDCQERSDYPITDRMICAGDASGHKGVCKGDSGGPLFCRRKDYRWVLLGIVSWGEGCKRTSKYDIFANICSVSGNFTAWIEEQMFVHPCNQCHDDNGCQCKKPLVNIV
jgi:uncharacterized protein YegL